MNYPHIIDNLEKNKSIFRTLFQGLPREEYLWKQSPEKWCPLEIICHLRDEEKEDFRTRVGHVLTTPESAPPPINPVGWVVERKYIEQDFKAVLADFLKEREASVKWLKSLENPKWDNIYHHPKLGPLSANMFLSNWSAHDYLHIKQMTRLKYDYLTHVSGQDLSYAGNWV